MLHILLLILKILGILLLVLFLLLLMVLALILFVPVRYKGKGSYFERTQVNVAISWLLHMVQVSVVYEGDSPKWKLRVFGILIKSSSITTRDGKHKGTKKWEDIGLAEDDELTGKESVFAKFDKNVKEDILITKSRERTFEERVGKENAPEENRIEQKQSFLEKIKTIFLKIKEKAKAFIEKRKAMKDKVSAIMERIRFFWNWWNLETTRIATSHCKEELFCLLQHIAPRKYKVDLHFGTGDPAATGQILGVIGMIYPLTKGQLRITPEFQEKILEGRFDLKGRIFLCKLLAIAWRILWDKNVRAAYASWKEKGSNVSFGCE